MRISLYKNIRDPCKMHGSVGVLVESIHEFAHAFIPFWCVLFQFKEIGSQYNHKAFSTECGRALEKITWK